MEDAMEDFWQYDEIQSPKRQRLDVTALELEARYLENSKCLGLAVINVLANHSKHFYYKNPTMRFVSRGLAEQYEMLHPDIFGITTTKGNGNVLGITNLETPILRFAESSSKNVRAFETPLFDRLLFCAKKRAWDAWNWIFIMIEKLCLAMLEFNGNSWPEQHLVFNSNELYSTLIAADNPSVFRDYIKRMLIITGTGPCSSAAYKEKIPDSYQRKLSNLHFCCFSRARDSQSIIHPFNCEFDQFPTQIVTQMLEEEQQRVKDIEECVLQGRYLVAHKYVEESLDQYVRELPDGDELWDQESVWLPLALDPDKRLTCWYYRAGPLKINPATTGYPHKSIYRHLIHRIPTPTEVTILNEELLCTFLLKNLVPSCSNREEIRLVIDLYQSVHSRQATNAELWSILMPYVIKTNDTEFAETYLFYGKIGHADPMAATIRSILSSLEKTLSSDSSRHLKIMLWVRSFLVRKPQVRNLAWKIAFASHQNPVVNDRNEAITAIFNNPKLSIDPFDESVSVATYLLYCNNWSFLLAIFCACASGQRTGHSQEDFEKLKSEMLTLSQTNSESWVDAFDQCAKKGWLYPSVFSIIQ